MFKTFWFVTFKLIYLLKLEAQTWKK